MPGTAIVTIDGEEWSVNVANTPSELITGLSGRASLPAGTGMLFVLPARQVATIQTNEMLFPIDIIFIKDGTVLSIAGNISPGYLVEEATPCDMFLEINADEADLVEVGAIVSTVTIQEPVTNGFNQITAFVIPLAILAFVFGMLGSSPSSNPKQLSSGNPSRQLGVPKTEVERKETHYAKYGSKELPERGKGREKVTVKCPICEKAIEVGEYDSVTRTEALRKHIEKEHAHHSMWLTLEQRKELEKKYGMVAVRWAEEATKPGDVKAAEAAAEYYYGKVREALGLGHLSPELSEEQIMKLREVLGLPADVSEILKIHQETGYIP